METRLATSIDAVEVAFVRKGFATALDVVAVRAVECGALALEDGKLRVADPARAGDALSAALCAAAADGPSWSTARDRVAAAAGETRRSLERRLIANGMLREGAMRWISGRRTEHGKAWLRAAQLAFPAEQIVAGDPGLALALHGPHALDGTRYHAATVAANRNNDASSSGSGCGATFAESGSHGGDGGHSGDGGGHSGGDGSGGCSSSGCSSGCGGGCGGG
ncbi:MAG: hypothetical protein JO103_06860 [Candidatus Eremiobacteraeota bacterium]|nr:hypothetical protein [Candidatus Eremiobacteraeota bacterium]MBV9407776.1 hypothetical protein [Candidatus Eremiobacteraeota bacterium]